MPADWGECSRVPVGNTTQKVLVFVGMLCYSRMTYIEFSLSQRKAEFCCYLVHVLDFFRASPRALIPDYVLGHIIEVMFPTLLCGRNPFASVWEALTI
jgi:transposase